MKPEYKKLSSEGGNLVIGCGSCVEEELNPWLDGNRKLTKEQYESLKEELEK